MKIFNPHFAYKNGVYALVQLENYQFIEKYGQNEERYIEIKPQENEQDKVTNIWLVIYQSGKLLTNNGKDSSILNKETDDFNAFRAGFENIQVDMEMERTFLVPFQLKSCGFSKSRPDIPSLRITPFYKDGQDRGAEIQFSRDDFNSLLDEEL